MTNENGKFKPLLTRGEEIARDRLTRLGPDARERELVRAAANIAVEAIIGTRANPCDAIELMVVDLPRFTLTALGLDAAHAEHGDCLDPLCAVCGDPRDNNIIPSRYEG